MAASIFEGVEEAVREHDMFPSGAPVLLMVSGGGDSVALLHLMVRLRGNLPLGDMRVLHINHELRGVASDGDERFVVELARQLDVPCMVRHADIAGLREQERGNLENVGRKERYRLAGELLDEMCLKAHVPLSDGRIVTAHTCDDRVETFIMRSIVGTGPGGLSSIAYRAGRVVRPLLGLARDDLRTFLEEETDPLCVDDLPSARWREDATNDDTTRFRSFVRHNIIPQARVFNPAFEETLCRSMDLIADEDAMLREQTTRQIGRLVETELDGTVNVDVAGLEALPVPLRRRVLHRLITDLLGHDARVDNLHIEKIVYGAAEPGFALSLPGDHTVRNEYGKLVFGSARDTFRLRDLPGDWLDIPGSMDCGRAGTLKAGFVDASEVLFGSAYEVYVDGASLTRLWVRSVREGDRMQPLGMGGNTKKLSDLLIDGKVPRHVRSIVPVVCAGPASDAPIVWLAGIRVDERYRVGPHTAKRVRLSLEPPVLPPEKR